MDTQDPNNTNTAVSNPGDSTAQAITPGTDVNTQSVVNPVTPPTGMAPTGEASVMPTTTQSTVPTTPNPSDPNMAQGEICKCGRSSVDGKCIGCTMENGQCTCPQLDQGGQPQSGNIDGTPPTTPGGQTPPTA